MIPRLKETYKKEIQQDLKNKFGYKNIYMVYCNILTIYVLR